MPSYTLSHSHGKCSAKTASGEFPIRRPQNTTRKQTIRISISRREEETHVLRFGFWPSYNAQNHYFAYRDYF
jgi:hypothetical protein